MTKLIFLLVLLCSFQALGATCTSTTRNNYTTNQVLTSTALNADLNQLVTKANAMDAGCLTNGTLEAAALNSTDFAVPLKAIKEGCKVSYSSATQVSIGKCLSAVNGAFVSTTIATTVAFGCTNCSAEVVSTTYYVYIATGSTGTTLTPLILTTVPNEDGYDDLGNKVIGSFYNNASSDIDQYSLRQWVVNQFISLETPSYPSISKPKICYYAFGGASATLASPTECTTGTCVEVYDSCGTGTAPTWTGSVGTYLNMTFAAGTFANSSFMSCRCSAFDTTTSAIRACNVYFETGDQTWSSSSTGGAVLNAYTQNQSGTGFDTHTFITCTGSAP
jgi:hypothetical protein